MTDINVIIARRAELKIRAAQIRDKAAAETTENTGR